MGKECDAWANGKNSGAIYKCEWDPGLNEWDKRVVNMIRNRS